MIKKQSQNSSMSPTSLSKTASRKGRDTSVLSFAAHRSTLGQQSTAYGAPSRARAAGISSGSMASKQNNDAGAFGSHEAIVIFDEVGSDVTPRPLYSKAHPSSPSAGGSGSGVMASGQSTSSGSSHSRSTVASGTDSIMSGRMPRGSAFGKASAGGATSGVYNRGKATNASQMSVSIANSTFMGSATHGQQPGVQPQSIQTVAGADFFTSLEAQTLANQFAVTENNNLNFGASMIGGSTADSRGMKSFTSNTDERSMNNNSFTSEKSMDEEHTSFTRLERSSTKRKNTEAIPERELADVDANLVSHVMLTMSEVEDIFDLPSYIVPSDDPAASAVAASNARYSKIIECSSSNNNAMTRSTQTYENAAKNKDVQASLLKVESIGCQANDWSIYDAFVEKVKTDDTTHDILAPKKNNDDDNVAASVEALTAMSDSMNDDSTVSDSQYSNSKLNESLKYDTIQKTEDASVSGPSIFGGARSAHSASNRLMSSSTLRLESLNQESLKKTIKIMESVTLEPQYSSLFLAYRGYDAPMESDSIPFEMQVPSMQNLWSYSCDFVRGRPVTSISWNKALPDLLAAGYGSNKQKAGTNNCHSQSVVASGLICCWSLKNPENPACVFECTSGVTSIDFSSSSVNLLAVGFADGRIAIYDVRKNGGVIADSMALSGKHRNPVWQIKWVEKELSIGDEQSHTEAIVSISTDGRVCQWLLRKGLECVDLMTLKMAKQQTGAQSGTSNNSLFISRASGGLSFDFNHSDTNMYLIATEDGSVHKCSVSYNEQYLNSYYGHTGPINKVKWSPFSPDVFITCSADWSIGMWHQDHEKMLVRFQAGKDSIIDVDWSPGCPTMFASVSYDGRVDIWDIAQSSLDPIITQTLLSQPTCCAFAPKTSVLVTGDEIGGIVVHRLRKIHWNNYEDSDVASGGAGLKEKVLTLAHKNTEAKKP